MTPPPLTGNRLVAYNLRAVREERGLTQDQASALLAPYVEAPWSRATWSAAERSADSDRVRHFSADDLLALALAFDVPVSYFFLPPAAADERRAAGLGVAAAPVAWDDLVTGPVLGRGVGGRSFLRRLWSEEAAQTSGQSLAMGPEALTAGLDDVEHTAQQLDDVTHTLRAFVQRVRQATEAREQRAAETAQDYLDESYDEEDQA